MKKDKLYVLFHCDEWKSHSSMNMIGVFTIDMLEDVVIREIGKNKDSGWYNSSFHLLSVRQINEVITYGYVEEVEVNELVY